MIKRAAYQVGDKDQPAMLLLHGFMGRGTDWEVIAKKVGGQFFVIAPDLAGHGENVKCKQGELSMQVVAHEVIGMLDDAGIKRCVGVGYSMGGRLLLYLATHYPERFERIVLESASPGLATEALQMQRKQWDLAMAEKLRTISFEKFLRQWYAMPLFDTFRAQPNFEQAFARRLENDPQQLALSMEEMGTGSMGSLWEAWALLNRDSLLIVGEHDAKYRQIANQMAGLNDQSAVMVVKNAGHNVHFEQPELFATLIGDIKK